MEKFELTISEFVYKELVKYSKMYNLSIEDYIVSALIERISKDKRDKINKEEN